MQLCTKSFSSLSRMSGVCLRVIIALALVCNVSAKTKKDKKKASAQGTPAPRLNMPIPPGHEAKGIKVPYYDDKGKLQMLFVIGSAVRLDETRLKMEGLQLETYDATGTPEMSVDFKTSFLDLNTLIVSTEEPVTIRRSDFEITGETMQLNTETRQGRMIGKVRMLIYNQDELTPEATHD